MSNASNTFQVNAYSFPYPYMRTAFYPTAYGYYPYFYSPQAFYGDPYNDVSRFGLSWDGVHAGDGAPDFCYRQESGERLTQYMLTDCVGGAVGYPCCPGHIESVVCLNNDHTSGSSVGLRACRRYAVE